MLIQDLPSYAQSVHRSLSSPAGTGSLSLYTVPTGRTLYITSAYIAGISDGAAFTLQTVSEDNDTLQNILAMPAGSGTVPIVLTVAGLWRVRGFGAVNGIRFVWDQPVTYGFAGWLA